MKKIDIFYLINLQILKIHKVFNFGIVQFQILLILLKDIKKI
jgi:hypothetical protein